VCFFLGVNRLGNESERTLNFHFLILGASCSEKRATLFCCFSDLAKPLHDEDEEHGGPPEDELAIDGRAEELGQCERREELTEKFAVPPSYDYLGLAFVGTTV
jgi:hypothetical protein